MQLVTALYIHYFVHSFKLSCLSVYVYVIIILKLWQCKSFFTAPVKFLEWKLSLCSFQLKNSEQLLLDVNARALAYLLRPLE